MVEEYVIDLALQMGIKPSKVVLTEGQLLGCYDACLLSIVSGGKLVSEFIRNTEIEGLKDNVQNNLLELKVKAAITRLKMMLAV